MEPIRTPFARGTFLRGAKGFAAYVRRTWHSRDTSTGRCRVNTVKQLPELVINDFDLFGRRFREGFCVDVT